MSICESPPRDEKEGPRAPLFLCRNTILAITTAVCVGGGFGCRFVTEAAFVLTVLLLLLDGGKWTIPAMVAILAICLYEPALMQVTPLLAALLFTSNRPKHGLLALAGAAAQMIGAINPYFIPLGLIPLIFIAALNRWRVPAPSQSVLTVALLALMVFPTIRPQSAPSGHASFAFPYRIDVASRLGKSGHQNTYTSIDDHGDLVKADVLVLEHDPPHGLATHNWNQKRLWSANQYFGAPLFRIAVGLDGYLYSNLGCKVDSTLRLLAEAHRTEHSSFISKKGGKLILSDSDFVNNASVGYQMHLNSALFERFSLSQAILLVSSVAALLGITRRGRHVILPLLLVLSVAAVTLLHRQKIDIRISDSQEIWPHSKGVAGIGAEITAETGVKTVARNGNARILGVARDCSASRENERVIVMEGGSMVKIGSKTFEALDLPMGESKGILDALPVRETGSEEKGTCYLRIGEVTLIGTNSARSNWERIYDAAK